MSDNQPLFGALAVVLIDFSRLADDRATFALLDHAWAGASATRSAWSPDFLEGMRLRDGDACRLLGVVLHAPAQTSATAVQEAVRAVHAAQPGLSLLVSDEPIATLPPGMTGVVRSAFGHSAVDALALVRMLVSLASPNEWACLDVEDVLEVCVPVDTSSQMPLRLMTGAWLADAGQLMLPGRFDAEVLSRAEAVWLHVDALCLKGDVLRQILQALRAHCDADMTLVFNAPFRHALASAWGGRATSLVLLVREAES
ncbi:hypothetical protein [Sphaerotilus mobilis]|uniref:hypothetical protein n=1 Tax=Sphaerotilus mobilis TaxID=47994 RepID=UPI00102B6552|nr:hypothetical protein [Sphaerotilus mobilis]